MGWQNLKSLQCVELKRRGFEKEGYEVEQNPKGKKEAMVAVQNVDKDKKDSSRPLA